MPMPPQPWTPQRRRWPTVLLLIGSIGGGASLLGVLLSSSNYHACSSGLGQFGQVLDADLQRQCTTWSAVYHLGILGLVVGVVLVICAVIGISTDPGRRQPPAPPPPWQPPPPWR